MADPLSIAASAAGLLSLGIEVSQSLVAYYSAFKDRTKDVERAIGSLDDLRSSLQWLQDALKDQRVKPEDGDGLQRIESSVAACERSILELQEEYRKFESKTGLKPWQTAKSLGRNLAYPIRKDGLKKLEDNVRAARDNIETALQVVRLRDSQRLKDEIEIQTALLEAVRADQLDGDLQRWLGAPDATFDFNLATQKRHPATGLWLTEGTAFNKWLQHDSSFLWLSGFAGCGKSVLCSTAIQAAFSKVKSKAPSKVGVAFFFFTFRDDSKQDQTAMLKALLLQLSHQAPGASEPLQSLYKTHRRATPTALDLLECLKKTASCFDELCILLDALDECPRDQTRDGVLDSIGELRGIVGPALHLLVTSRDEVDIRDALDPRVGENVQLKNENIDRDITSFIDERLQSDRNLRRKWSHRHERIVAALSEKAGGVFRWVECQFLALRSCPRTDSDLDKCLNSLPASLDETYERILLSIDDQAAPVARQLLLLLCFAEESLEESRMVAALTVKTGTAPYVDRQAEFGGFDDLLDMCPNLIEISTSTYSGEQVLSLAHFSVKEYLVSKRILRGPASGFALDEPGSHDELATMCLVYMHHHLTACTCTLEPWERSDRVEKDSEPVNEASLSYERPFLNYATRRWHMHYQKVPQTSSACRHQVSRLFKRTGRRAFDYWLAQTAIQYPYDKGPRGDETPLWLASQMGFKYAVDAVLEEVRDREELSVLLDQSDTEYGTPLHVACWEGHIDIAQMLLDKGSRLDGLHRCRSPLYWAMEGGHEELAQVLIARGADVNLVAFTASSSEYNWPRGLNEEILDTWRGRGWLEPEPGGFPLSTYSPISALHLAACSGSAGLVHMLVRAGADIDLFGHIIGPLQQYGPGVRPEREYIFRRLADRAQSRYLECCVEIPPLHVAAHAVRPDVVRALLDVHADPCLRELSSRGHDSQHFLGNTALHALLYSQASPYKRRRLGGQQIVASSEVTTAIRSITRLLLEVGIGVNIPNLDGETALHVAAKGCDLEIFEDLLDHGANINARNHEGETPLLLAASYCPPRVVKRLLERGADVNAKAEGTWFAGTALINALVTNSPKIAEVLINHHANIHQGNGSFQLEVFSTGERFLPVRRYEDALQAAALHKYTSIVELLLDKGANIQEEGDHFRNALVAACSKLPTWNAMVAACSKDPTWSPPEKTASVAILEMLIHRGQVVDLSDDRYSVVLQTACAADDAPAVRLLLTHGIAPQAQGFRDYCLRKMCNRLDAEFSNDLHDTVAAELLEAGTNPNVGHHLTMDTPLHLASFRHVCGTIEHLLRHGADPNFENKNGRTPLQLAAFSAAALEARSHVFIEGHDCSRTMQRLLQAGARVDGQWGHGALLAAVRAYSARPRGAKVLEFLLDHGAKPLTQGLADCVADFLAAAEHNAERYNAECYALQLDPHRKLDPPRNFSEVDNKYDAYEPVQEEWKGSELLEVWHCSD